MCLLYEIFDHEFLLTSIAYKFIEALSNNKANMPRHSFVRYENSGFALFLSKLCEINASNDRI
jgi:hypothetical protein